MSRTSSEILLTGARGRIARAIRASLGETWSIHSFSHQENPDAESIEALFEDSSARSSQALIHTAWSVLPLTAEKSPTAHREIDLPLLEKLIEYFRADSDESVPLFIFLSTGAVYGLAANSSGSKESDTASPIGAYASSKLEAEDLLRDSGIPHCILRIGNVYGLPSDPGEAQGVIPRLIRLAGSGTAFSMWGGDTQKDYLHRDDFLSALQCVVDQRLEGTWNLGYGETTRLSEIIEQVQSLTGETIEVEDGPGIPWDVSDNRLDTSAFCKKTGWSPKISIQKGLEMEVTNSSNFRE